MYSKPNKINTIDLGRFVLFKLSFYNNIAFLANIANVRQNFQTKFTYTGAEEQFLLRGAQVNKKNEILTNFQNLT